mmetsp:Transcript_30212/g.78005  ORF Transcript_30212/g.78005 Transcript_30212/m.78005 type:complete len:276 (-) Transcript_30212:674-1501(-)
MPTQLRCRGPGPRVPDGEVRSRDCCHVDAVAAEGNSVHIGGVVGDGAEQAPRMDVPDCDFPVFGDGSKAIASLRPYGADDSARWTALPPDRGPSGNSPDRGLLVLAHHSKATPSMSPSQRSRAARQHPHRSQLHIPDHHSRPDMVPRAGLRPPRRQLVTQRCLRQLTLVVHPRNGGRNHHQLLQRVPRQPHRLRRRKNVVSPAGNDRPRGDVPHRHPVAGAHCQAQAAGAPRGVVGEARPPGDGVLLVPGAGLPDDHAAADRAGGHLVAGGAPVH